MWRISASLVRYPSVGRERWSSRTTVSADEASGADDADERGAQRGRAADELVNVPIVI